MSAKYIKHILILVSLVLLGVTTAYANITGSKHDFSSQTWSGNQICTPCHTPHHAQTVEGAPLWNHAVTTQTFTPYDSPTMDQWKPGQPTNNSKLCLSCHDGITALDAFGDRSGTTVVTGDANINDFSLTNDHPVSFEWRHQTAGNCTTQCHFVHGHTTTPLLPVYGVSGSKKIECATCHDVHRKDETLPSLLRITMDRSELCIYCHRNKGE